MKNSFFQFLYYYIKKSLPQIKIKKKRRNLLQTNNRHIPCFVLNSQMKNHVLRSRKKYGMNKSQERRWKKDLLLTKNYCNIRYTLNFPMKYSVDCHSTWELNNSKTKKIRKRVEPNKLGTTKRKVERARRIRRSSENDCVYKNIKNYK